MFSEACDRLGRGEGFLSREHLAALYNKCTKTITRWSGDGTLPAPDCTPTKRTILWKAVTIRNHGLSMNGNTAPAPATADTTAN